MNCLKKNLAAYHKKMRVIVGILIAILFLQNADAQIKGKLKTIPSFKSKFVDARRVDFWMPEGIPAGTKLSVLIMHDGQMLFDSNSTWNHQEWAVDETITQLYKEKKIPPLLVIAVWNNGSKRHFEYMPELALKQNLNKPQLDSLLYVLRRDKGNGKIDSVGFLGENYLKFLTKEILPYASKNFPLKSGKNNTAIMGSSMGGIISLYAACRYPDVFGKSAALSMHWPILYSNDLPYPDAILSFMRTHIPDPSKGNRFYIDSGTETLDALYPVWLKRGNLLMKDIGYSSNQYKSQILEGEDHSERAWAKRLASILEYLYQKQ